MFAVFLSVLFSGRDGVDNVTNSVPEISNTIENSSDLNSSKYGDNSADGLSNSDKNTDTLAFSADEISSYAPPGKNNRQIVYDIQSNRSEKLKMYEDILDPFLSDMANAAALQLCGLRDVNWFKNIKSIIERQIAMSRDLNEVRKHLTKNEVIATQAYANWTVNTIGNWLSTNQSKSGCDDLSMAPYIYKLDLLEKYQLNSVAPRKYLTLAQWDALDKLPVIDQQQIAEQIQVLNRCREWAMFLRIYQRGNTGGRWRKPCHCSFDCC